MTTNGDYYNESYAPIHSDYLAAEAHARRAASDRTVPTPRATVNNQELSRPKRRSRYDENNYALPDEEYDENGSTVTPRRENNHTQQENARTNRYCTRKKVAIAVAVFVLLLVGGVAGYIATRAAGIYLATTLTDH